MRTWITVIVVLLVLAWAGTSFFIVDQTRYAVQLRFGDPVRAIVEPGLYVKAPWPIDTVTPLDNRLLVLLNPGADEPDREYLTQDADSGIGKNIVVTTYTVWRIRRDAGAVRKFIETMGDTARAAARIGDVVVSELGAALGSNDFSALVSTEASQRRWSELLDEVRDKCAARVEDAYGVELVDVQIQRLNFPGVNRRAVFDRMEAEREKIATRYRSAGEQEATSIRAAAERERMEILAKAYEEASRIRGEADAEAAQIYADAYGRDPEFYSFVRTLETYGEVLGKNTVAVLSSNSEFLRLLNPAASEVTPETPSSPPMSPPAPPSHIAQEEPAAQDDANAPEAAATHAPPHGDEHQGRE